MRGWPGDELDLEAVDDFAALHDLVLYVLGPLAHGGEVDYADPLVEAATALLLAPETARLLGGLGPVGQNRLYVFRKRS